MTVVWVVYKRGTYEEGTFIGVFETEEKARLAAHHPYDRSDIYEVTVDALHNDWPEAVTP